MKQRTLSLSPGDFIIKKINSCTILKGVYTEEYS